MHWTEHYIGRPYVKNQFDCVELVRNVLFCERGIAIAAPKHRQWRDWNPDKILETFGDQVYEVTANQETDFDIVLMRIMGDTRELGGHVGLFTRAGDRRRVLHCMEKLHTRLDLIELLPHRGMQVEGIYRCLP